MFPPRRRLAWIRLLVFFFAFHISCMHIRFISLSFYFFRTFNVAAFSIHISIPFVSTINSVHFFPHSNLMSLMTPLDGICFIRIIWLLHVFKYKYERINKSPTFLRQWNKCNCHFCIKTRVHSSLLFGTRFHCAMCIEHTHTWLQQQQNSTGI